MEYKRIFPFDKIIILLKELYRYIIIYKAKYYLKNNHIFFRKRIKKFENISSNILLKCEDINSLKLDFQCNTNFIFINKYLLYFKDWILKINNIFSRKLKNLEFMIGRKYKLKKVFYINIIMLILDIIDKTNICRNKVIKKILY